MQGTLIQTLNIHNKAVLSIIHLENTTYVASGGADNIVYLWYIFFYKNLLILIT